MPKNTFPSVIVYLGHLGKHGTDALAEKGRQMISLYHLPPHLCGQLETEGAKFLKRDLGSLELQWENKKIGTRKREMIWKDKCFNLSFPGRRLRHILESNAISGTEFQETLVGIAGK